MFAVINYVTIHCSETVLNIASNILYLTLTMLQNYFINVNVLIMSKYI